MAPLFLGTCCHECRRRIHSFLLAFILPTVFKNKNIEVLIEYPAYRIPRMWVRSLETEVEDLLI